MGNMGGGEAAYVIINHQLSVASSVIDRGRYHMVYTCSKNTSVPLSPLDLAFV